MFHPPRVIDSGFSQVARRSQKEAGAAGAGAVVMVVAVAVAAAATAAALTTDPPHHSGRQTPAVIFTEMHC